MSKYIIIFCCKNDEHSSKVKSSIPSNFEAILLEREKYGVYWNISCFTNNNEIEVIITENNRNITIKEINSIYLPRDFTIESQDISEEYTEGEKKNIATQRSIHVNSCIKYLSEIKPTINPESNYASLSDQFGFMYMVGDVPKSIADMLSVDYSQNLVCGGIVRMILPNVFVIPGKLQKITSKNLYACSGDSALLPKDKTQCIICNEDTLNSWINYDYGRGNLFCNSEDCLLKYNKLINNDENFGRISDQ